MVAGSAAENIDLGSHDMKIPATIDSRKCRFYTILQLAPSQQGKKLCIGGTFRIVSNAMDACAEYTIDTEQYYMPSVNKRSVRAIEILLCLLTASSCLLLLIQLAGYSMGNTWLGVSAACIWMSLWVVFRHVFVNPSKRPIDAGETERTRR